MRNEVKKQVVLIGFVLLLIVLLPGVAMAKESLAIKIGNETTISSMTELSTLSDTTDVTNQVVVIYKTPSTTNIQSLGISTNEIKGGESVSDRVDVLELNDGVDQVAFIQALNENPNVMAADKNKIVRMASLPDDPYILNDYAWQFEDIGADETWNQVSNDETVVVAVLDTGVNANHPDLVGRLVDGYDYITQSTKIVDHDGHGTCVSGCISALADNGVGIAGVAGTADVKIASYCIGDEYYDDSTICAALIACADREDIDVINMSYGGYESSRTERSAIEYASQQGKILVASSGNEGDDRRYAGKYSYPASYDNVISVAATDSQDEVSYFSQYNDQVDLAAPGEEIYTTSKNGSYESIDGTSFSSPIVAGACAVVLAANPGLSADEVETILEETALDIDDSGKDDYSGYGLIQLNKALEVESSDTPLTSISLDQSAFTLTVGNSKSLTVNYSPKDTTDDKTVKWRSTDTDIATVTSAGKVVAVGAGTTTITATVGVFTAQCQVTVTTKVEEDVDCLYRTHVQNEGWQEWAENGSISGTSGQSYRLEGIEVKLAESGYDLGIEYQTHVQNVGWQDSVSDGNMSGTSGKGLRLEAIRINLTGDDAENFEVYYRVHAQNFGWLDWAKDGEESGTAGFGYRLEAIEIEVVHTGTVAPGSSDKPFIDANE